MNAPGDHVCIAIEAEGVLRHLLANSTAKLFMGPITDQETRGYLRELIGDEGTRTHESARASAHALQQLERDRSVLVTGDLPPMIVSLRPYWVG